MKLTSASICGVAIMLMTVGTASAKDWKVVNIGIEGGYEPYNLTAPNGKIVGFEPDLAENLCKRIKIECKLVAQDWDGMIPGLQAGKFDVIIDGMAVTAAREKVIDFSKPYAQSPSAFVAAKDGPLGKLAMSGKIVNLDKDKADAAAALKEFRDALKGKTIGVQVSTVFATFASKNLKDVATVKEYKTTDERDLDLKAGRLDAILDEEPPIRSMLAKPDSSDFAIVGPELAGGDFGIGVAAGFRKSDKDLSSAFDTALASAFADGSIKPLYMKWFKMDVTPR
jgi:octopine/nopaline transport system substrate-binding protein